MSVNWASPFAFRTSPAWRMVSYAGAALWAAVAAMLCVTAMSQVPMGPGSMAPYTGQGFQQRRMGYVRDPAKGFWVAGSSIKEMNGIYKRIENVPMALGEGINLAYRKWPYDSQDTLSGWHLVLAKSAEYGQPNWPPTGGKSSEWLFIDPEYNHRFGHVGETVIPGAGTKWQHLHRGKQADGEATQVAAPDNEDELPWQIIFIGDEQMVENIRYSEMVRTNNVRKAIGGGVNCKERQAGCGEEEPPVEQDYLGIRALENLVDEAKYEECIELASKEEANPYGGWRMSEIKRWKAHCHRKLKDYVGAMDNLAASLRIKPGFKLAHFEMGLTMLDAGRPAVAISCFDRLLKLDRTWPRIDEWITMSHASAKRSRDEVERMLPTVNPDGSTTQVKVQPRRPDQAESDRKLSEATVRAGWHEGDIIYSTDHYAVLGVSADHTPEELKKAYRTASRAAHPDKHKGSNDAFQKVALAHETLSDVTKRELYNEGSDIRRELRDDGSEGPSFAEQIHRQYFPERFEFLPFGDPFEHKKRIAEERRLSTPPAPNGPNIPRGPYMGTCQGCSIQEGKQGGGDWLRCTHCMTGEGRRFLESTIGVGECKEDERITNHHGALMCEADPDAAARLINSAPPDDDATDPKPEL